MSMSLEFWGPPYEEEVPIVSAKEIQQWEETLGVSLPDTLGAALRLQNGGYVNSSNIVISPLSEIVALTGQRWIYLSEDSLPFGNPTRLIMFGILDGVSASLVLNYNAGMKPQVIHLWHDLGDELRDEGDGTFDEFLEKSTGKNWHP